LEGVHFLGVFTFWDAKLISDSEVGGSFGTISTQAFNKLALDLLAKCINKSISGSRKTLTLN
jgi:hypothetical protein